jgi:hypothetical protein
MPAPRRRGAGDDYGSTHRRVAQQLKYRLRDGDPCCRCGRPMYRWMLPLDVDAAHRDLLDGELPDALNHRSCNRTQLANTMQGGKPPLPPRPTPLPEW